MSPALKLSLRKRLSSLVFPRYSPVLERVNWTARWIADMRKVRGGVPVLAGYKNLHSWVNSQFFENGAQPVDYLEFGVWEGLTLSHWCASNQHPQSRFYGFDSFDGLPEDWRRRLPAGSYKVQGVPEFSDPRVQLVKGLFQNSLPSFLTGHVPRNPIVIHNDSDLYSSTLYALTMMDRFIHAGALIVFDEFYDVLHEFRALHNYAEAYRRKFEIVAATEEFARVAVRIC